MSVSDGDCRTVNYMEDALVIRFGRSFCRMSCDYDYFEDLIYELDELDEDPPLIAINEINYAENDKFSVKYTLRKDRLRRAHVKDRMISMKLGTAARSPQIVSIPIISGCMRSTLSWSSTPAHRKRISKQHSKTTLSTRRNSEGHTHRTKQSYSPTALTYDVEKRGWQVVLLGIQREAEHAMTIEHPDTIAVQNLTVAVPK